jgi:hypothetical protein
MLKMIGREHERSKDVGEREGGEITKTGREE